MSLRKLNKETWEAKGRSRQVLGSRGAGPGGTLPKKGERSPHRHGRRARPTKQQTAFRFTRRPTAKHCPESQIGVRVLNVYDCRRRARASFGRMHCLSSPSQADRHYINSEGLCNDSPVALPPTLLPLYPHDFCIFTTSNLFKFTI